MYRLIITIWLVLFILPGITVAQGRLDFNTINTETYRFYEEQKWDSLIHIGKEALKEGIDFYYLRMRIGIAYYQNKNYRRAGDHFRVALELNQGDPVALEYLYYSMLFSGQSERSQLIRKEFKGELASRLPGQKGKFIESFGLEYLFSYSNNEDNFTNPEKFYSGYPPGVQMTTRQFSNFSFSLKNRVTPGFSLVHTYSYLSKDSHYYYRDGTYEFYMQDLHVNQHQYYLSPLISTSSGFTIRPAFHLVGGQFQVPIEVTYGSRGNQRVTTDNVAYRDWIGGVGLQKVLGCFDLQLEGYYTTLNQSEHLQNRLGFTWFPLGNLNLYTGGFFNSQYELTDGNVVFRLIYEILLAFSIKEKVWVDLNGTLGDITNYVERNGQIVYNGYSDIIQNKVKLTLSIPVTERGSLIYLGGRWTSHQSGYVLLDPAETGESNIISYNAFSIYGGLSWEF